MLSGNQAKLITYALDLKLKPNQVYTYINKRKRPNTLNKYNSKDNCIQSEDIHFKP